MSAVCGSTKSSSDGAYGSGTSCAVTRSTGASSHSKQRLVDPRRDLAGDAARPRVLVHDQHAVRLLHGRDDRLVVERRERAQVDDLDADSPSSLSSCSAASSALYTVAAYVMIETSVPSRATRALPIGTT